LKRVSREANRSLGEALVLSGSENAATKKCSGDDAHGSGDSRQVIAALQCAEASADLLYSALLSAVSASANASLRAISMNFAVAQLDSHVNLQIAGLPCAKKNSYRDPRRSKSVSAIFEPVRRAHHRFEARGHFRSCAAGGNKNAMGFVSSAPILGAQLMQLRQTESFGACSITIAVALGTSTPTSTTGCRTKNLRFRFSEALHDGFFFFR